MSKFNTKTIGSTITTNHEGVVAYKMTPELELYSMVCTSTLSSQFYTPDNKVFLKRLRDIISQVSPEFVAKLAVYARENMNLRSIPLVLVVELAKAANSTYRTGLVSSVTTRVIQRADEITETLSYYAQANDRVGVKKLGKLSNQLKKGIADSFHKFNEYNFSKYNRKNEVRLRDAMFICHPKPLDIKEKELFRKIAEDTLDTPDTWETKMSEAGKSDSPSTSKKEVWETMIDSGKLGYMACLRNLRNILDADVSSDHIDKVCSFISDKHNVVNSKQFPFRFLSAYKMLVQGDSNLDKGRVLTALESAMIHSVENIPMFTDERIKIASDVSGSMNYPISEKSTVRMYDVGIVLSMLLQHKCKRVVTGIFGTEYLEQSLPKDSILENSMKMDHLSSKVGWSTNGYLVIKDAVDKNQELDRIMIFTDMQLWDSYGNQTLKSQWNTYKKMYPNCKLYLFDLCGYGTSPISLMDKDVYLIAGWSNEIFTIMNNIENGGDTLDVINSIVI